MDVVIEAMALENHVRVRRAALQPGKEIWATRHDRTLRIVPVRVLQGGDDGIFVTRALERRQVPVIGGFVFITGGMVVRTGATPVR